MAARQTIVGSAVANMPWEERPKGSDVVWRYSGNPLIPRYPFPGAQGVYNSAVIAFNDGFIGVMRVEHRDSMLRLHLARSTDGLHWEIERERIRVEGASSRARATSPRSSNWRTPSSPATATGSSSPGGSAGST